MRSAYKFHLESLEVCHEGLAFSSAPEAITSLAGETSMPEKESERTSRLIHAVVSTNSPTGVFPGDQRGAYGTTHPGRGT
jgi:hypothetical protein